MPCSWAAPANSLAARCHRSRALASAAGRRLVWPRSLFSTRTSSGTSSQTATSTSPPRATASCRAGCSLPNRSRRRLATPPSTPSRSTTLPRSSKASWTGRRPLRDTALKASMNGPRADASIGSRVTSRSSTRRRTAWRTTWSSGSGALVPATTKSTVTGASRLPERDSASSETTSRCGPGGSSLVSTTTERPSSAAATDGVWPRTATPDAARSASFRRPRTRTGRPRGTTSPGSMLRIGAFSTSGMGPLLVAPGERRPAPRRQGDPRSGRDTSPAPGHPRAATAFRAEAMHGRDAHPVVRRPADREPGDPGDVRADPGHPVEVADGVLRQPAAPALHVAVDRRARASPVASARSASEQATSSSSVRWSAASSRCRPSEVRRWTTSAAAPACRGPSPTWRRRTSRP